MIARFFIDRPIFAVVISLVIVLAGGVAVFTLPITQYPNVTPPVVLVSTIYPGANSQTVRDTVAAPIEEQVSGVEGMIYMSSRSTKRSPGKLWCSRSRISGKMYGLRVGMMPSRRALVRVPCRCRTRSAI